MATLQFISYCCAEQPLRECNGNHVNKELSMRNTTESMLIWQEARCSMHHRHSWNDSVVKDTVNSPYKGKGPFRFSSAIQLDSLKFQLFYSIFWKSVGSQAINAVKSSGNSFSWSCNLRFNLSSSQCRFRLDLLLCFWDFLLPCFVPLLFDRHRYLKWQLAFIFA